MVNCAFDAVKSLHDFLRSVHAEDRDGHLQHLDLRAEYLPERRQMMQWWADYIERLASYDGN
jgi:hypothetical protein